MREQHLQEVADECGLSYGAMDVLVRQQNLISWEVTEDEKRALKILAKLQRNKGWLRCSVKQHPKKDRIEILETSRMDSFERCIYNQYATKDGKSKETR